LGIDKGNGKQRIRGRVSAENGLAIESVTTLWIKEDIQKD
jgi:hypothetical protein